MPVDRLYSALSDLAVLEWGLGICISNKLPDVADTAHHLSLTSNLPHYYPVTTPAPVSYVPNGPQT